MAPRILIPVLAAAFLIAAPSVNAGSVGDFFKALGNSIAHPGQGKKRQQQQQMARHSKAKGATNTLPPDYPPSPTATPSAQPTPTPTQMPVRVASAPPTKNLRRDLPYAIPVPNKPGFVTSPYAPKQGIVDVRGFPSGTEVKDPYSGKVFLTP